MQYFKDYSNLIYLDCSSNLKKQIKGIIKPKLEQTYKLMDTWEVEEAIGLLLGFTTSQHANPTAKLYGENHPLARYIIIVHRLDGLETHTNENKKIDEVLQAIKKECLADRGELIKVFKSNQKHTKSHYPPKYYYKWAKSKKLDLPLLRAYPDWFNLSERDKQPSKFNQRVDAINVYLKANNLDRNNMSISREEFWGKLREKDPNLFSVSLDPKVLKKTGLKFPRGRKSTNT